MNKDNRMIKNGLRCPHCHAPMTLHEDSGAGVLCCQGVRTHSFDCARSGYVHLSINHSGGGDSREAVRARTEFLSAGYYEIAAAALSRLLQSHLRDGTVVDAGCGEGYYTNRLCADGQGRYAVMGFDLSQPAVEHAAKVARRMQLTSSATGCADYAVASIFELPLSDASTDAVVNVFAPCAEQEFCRVLKSGGVLIVVGAGERHLMGLKQVLYETAHDNATRADLPQGMTLVEKTTVSGEIVVRGQQHIRSLFSMTPYYWRTAPSDVQKLEGLDELRTEISFDFMVYRK